jgi:diguanylate cyclase (GGDEF)-like protein/PAS domain S-box-containing protein
MRASHALAAIASAAVAPVSAVWRDWPVGVVEIDAQGRVGAANTAAVGLLAPFGRLHAGVGFFGLLAAAGPELRGTARRLEVGEALRRRLRAGAGAGVALMLTRRADGGHTALVTDDSAAARAEAEAERARARFDALADWAPRAAIFALAPQARVTRWSRSAERLEGLEAAEAIGAPLGRLLDRAGVDADADALLAEAAARGEASASAWRPLPRGGSAWISLTLRAVRLGDGALDGFIAIARDMTASTDREAELRRLAETDPLTGALNRRAFFETVDGAASAVRPLGLAGPAAIALDLDGFKALNDRHGHAAGDAALRALAEAARGDLRAGDLLGRLGGDEFAVALPRADAPGAAAVAERLRATIERLRPRAGAAALRFTASFGVAAPRSADEPFEATLARADGALYAAKASGRNRVALG